MKLSVNIVTQNKKNTLMEQKMLRHTFFNANFIEIFE